MGFDMFTVRSRRVNQNHRVIVVWVESSASSQGCICSSARLRATFFMTISTVLESWPLVRPCVAINNQSNPWNHSMTFFSKKILRPRKIEIDHSAVSSNSPEVVQRLDRIQQNYQELDRILDDLETKIKNDARLSAIDQTIQDLEIPQKRKRWRPRKSTRKSVNPKKPR